MGRRALIYVQPGHVSRRKQVAACLKKITENGWEADAMVHPGEWRQAAQLIWEGKAEVLLMAYRPGDDEQSREHERIRQAVERAGGEVVYCRPVKEPKPRVQVPTDVDTEELTRRMFQAGCDTDQIVQVLRKSRLRICGILARLRGSAAPLLPVLMAAVLSITDLLQ